MDPWRTPEIIFDFFLLIIWGDVQILTSFGGSDLIPRDLRLDWTWFQMLLDPAGFFSPKVLSFEIAELANGFDTQPNFHTKSFENFPGVSDAEKDLKVRIDPQIFNRIQKSLKGKTQGTVWDWLMQTPAVKKTRGPLSTYV